MSRLRVGIIVANTAEKVGYFDFYSAMDSYSNRVLEDVTINKDFFDISMQAAKIPCRYLYVEVINWDENEYKIIEDLGFGILKGSSSWTDSQSIRLGKASLIKCPKNYNYEKLS